MVYHESVHESLRVLCDLIAVLRRSAASDLDFAFEVPRFHPQYDIAPDPRFHYPRVDQGYLWADLWTSANDRLRAPKVSMMSHCLNHAPFIFAQVTELSMNISDLLFGDRLYPGPPPIAPQMVHLALRVDICSNCPGPFVSFSEFEGMGSVWAYANWRHPGGYLRRWECPALRDVGLSLPARSVPKRPGSCEGDCLLAISGLEIFLRKYLVLPSAPKPLRSLTLPVRRVLSHEMPVARRLAEEVILADGAEIHGESDVRRGPVQPLPHWENSDCRWYSAPSNVFCTAESMPCGDTWDERIDANTLGPYTRPVRYS